MKWPYLLLPLTLAACMHKEPLPDLPARQHYLPTPQEFAESDIAVLVYPEPPKVHISPVDLPPPDARPVEKPRRGKRPVRPPETLATVQGSTPPGSDIFTFPYRRGGVYRVTVSPSNPVALLLPQPLHLAQPPVLDQKQDSPTAWDIGWSTSGKDESYQEILTLRPTLPGTRATTPLIFKSGHVFTLDLVSQTKPGHLTVTWQLPDFPQPGETLPMQAVKFIPPPPVQKPPKLDLDHLNIHYTFEPGKGPIPWMPAEAYDDGLLTVIRFPRRLTNLSAPILVVPQGKKTLPLEYTTYAVPDQPEKGEFYITRGVYPMLQLRDSNGATVTIHREAKE